MAQAGSVVLTVYCHPLTQDAVIQHAGGPGHRVQRLTGTGMGESCTFGPGAQGGLLGGSHCHSPGLWSC